MAENKPELNITGVEISEYRCGIPLLGWDSVKGALNAFANGASKKSRATEKNQLQAIGEEMGGFAMAFYGVFAPHLQGSGNQFVEEMLQRAEPSIKKHGCWEHHYDYDGMGSFFKTTVDIKTLPEQKDAYLLELHAAYVGKEVEDGLAEYLGVEQGLQWKNVKVGLAPEGNQFKIDFDPVAEKLQPIIAELFQLKGSKRITGIDVANYFMTVNEYKEQAYNFVLGIKDGVEVVLNLGEVKRRFEHRNGKVVADNWSQKESVISGLLGRDYNYEDETKLAPPSFIISIHRFSNEKYNRLPVVDPAMKATMNDLANKIASLFTPSAQ